jgi:hypothetical protein
MPRPVCRVEIQNLDVAICGILPIFHGEAPCNVDANPPSLAVRLGIVRTMLGAKTDTLERIEHPAPLRRSQRTHLLENPDFKE